MKKFAKTIFLWVCFAFPIITQAQEQGVNFEQGKTWQEITAMAKASNKYIFVDCFATWCGPCKAMDKDIYTNEKVADFYNANFFCVKLQMDSSKQDNDEVKSHYGDAHKIMQNYRITAYPTFLFFSPDGQLVHKGIGGKDVDDFFLLGNQALHKETQYYTLLEKYKKESTDTSSMMYLMKTAATLNDKVEAQTIADYYMQHYLFSLNSEKLFSKENIDFVTSFTPTSKAPGFNFIFKNAKKIDKVMGNPFYSEGIINYIAASEEIDPHLWVNGTAASSDPDWGKMENNIVRKYGKAYAEYSIIGAKARWYGYKKNWSEYTKYTSLFIQEFGSTMSNFDIDVKSYDIFQKSSNNKELVSTIPWMKKVITSERDSSNLLPASLDTYANILYKTGNKKEALKSEQIAIDLVTKFNKPKDMSEFSETIAKMKKNEPTW